MPRSTLSNAIMLAATFLAAGTFLASTIAAKPVAADGPIEYGPPIDNGVVLTKSRFTPPPYVVGANSDRLCINGHVLATEISALHVPRSDSAQPHPVETLASAASWIEDVLERGGLVIQTQQDRVQIFAPDQTALVLERLDPQASAAASAAALAQLDAIDFAPGARQQIAAAHVQSPRFRSWNKVLLAEHAQRTQPASSWWRWRLRFHAQNISYLITMLGLMLSTSALGMLLMHSPRRVDRWRQTNTSSRALRAVSIHTGFIVVLGIFDLACTIWANRAGGFAELNPMAESMIDNPAHLAMFKMASLAVSATILLSLRRYRGVQLACWWLCLICVVLTFRWATYNSLLTL